jgi:hypothetical protein
MYFKSTTGLTEKSLIEKHPLFYNDMLEFLGNIGDISLSERIWLFQNRLKEIPKCLNCENKVSFIKFYKGYRKYCSRKCSVTHTHKNESVKKKRTSKMISYNYDYDLKKKMVDKSNETKLNFSKEKKDEINNKRSETIKNLYGVDNISKLDYIKNKISKKVSKSIVKTYLEKTKKRILKEGYDIIKISNKNFKLKCKKCNQIFTTSRTFFNQRTRFKIEQCNICNPNNNDSFFEKDVFNFIDISYNGEIIRKYRKYKKYEIDIYLPDIGIGFECNGLWWHSDKYKKSEYHKDKSEFFRKEGIQIIHIWEDDWLFKKEIVKSRILNIFKKNNKIPAKKCRVVEIDNELYRKFMNENHLGGYLRSKIRIGLIHDSNLVACASFTRKLNNKYELVRFCSKKECTVVGGFSKILNYFINNFNPDSLITYDSCDWSTGKLYSNLEFNLIEWTKPNYFYFHKENRVKLNKSSFRKDVLVKEGHDPNKTEKQIMCEIGYRRVYDSGNLLFELKLKNLL